jgi:transketolase
MTKSFGPRRAVWVEVDEAASTIDAAEIARLERYDLIYRSVCSMMFNFTQSGHPGGSVSSGRIVTSLMFDTMDYDIGDPLRPDADIISYAAGHKALGLYAMLALRNDVVRIARPEMLPEAVALRLRLEDLLGFRRNPTHPSPLFKEFGSKPLDGHPTPATPFIKIATGPSGVGVATSLGLAVAARDYYGEDSPRVHIIEGEGGLTPGRVTEALAFAGTAGLTNAVMHLDWNQASIDSDAVTREGDRPGDYVQWDPMEMFYLHDWNVIEVKDGFDVGQVLTAQQMAAGMDNGQPTAIVYRTVKGWRYGIEGKKSHGGGHKVCSEGYFESVRPLFGDDTGDLPSCDGSDPVETEQAYWDTLLRVRSILETDDATAPLADRVAASKERLDGRALAARSGAPDVSKIYDNVDPNETPDGLRLEIGSKIALRSQLGAVLGHLNTVSDGGLLIAAADLLGSTAISNAAGGFPKGFFHTAENPGSRTLSVGGICEDGMTAVATGISGFGRHVGACASYAAFISPLGHIASRLHAISSDMRTHTEPGPFNPYVIICGHAGMKTGEDGPTHADPQALQLFQENFVQGTAITLTPWEPQEVWPLIAAAFAARPAVIAPFVTRPGEPVLDRAALGLAPAEQAAQGMYVLREAAGTPDATLVLQGSEVTYAFVQQTMPMLADAGIDLEVYLVTSTELFDRLDATEQNAVFSEEQAHTAMGITGFTRPTMYRWIRSDRGREHTLHPFGHGHCLGSGAGDMVVHEAGLDGDGQLAAIRGYLEVLVKG